MKIQKSQKRTYLLIILVVMLPVLFSIYSPVLMAWGVLNGIITLSAIIFALWFFLSLFLGRAASCGYTCPYGALQEIFGGAVLNKKAKNEKADNIKYFVFLAFITMAIYSILTRGGYQGVDLFASQGVYSVMGIASIQLAILIPLSIIAIGTLSMLFGSRAFCRYLCPQGVFLTIGAKIGQKLGIKSLNLIFDQDKCSNCDLCDKNCPMGLNVSEMVHKGSTDDVNCILCGECARVCSKDAIQYSWGRRYEHNQLEGDVDKHSQRERGPSPADGGDLK